MITSTSNQQIKNIIKLQKSGKARREQGVFIEEGIRMFTEIPREDLVKCYLTEEQVEKLTELARLEKLKNFNLEEIDYEVVSTSVFSEISDTKTPQGILAVVRQKRYTREDLLPDAGLVENAGKAEHVGNIGNAGLDKVPCILVLENLQDPGNLGTILRTAEGAGVTGIMMSKDTVDIYNSKVVRATMGAIFRVPFIYEENILDGVSWLKQQGITCYAAHLGGTNFYQNDYKKPTCFFIGNEGNGLTDELTAYADIKIKIPMLGHVESLNAATATTVLIYEAMRQRLTES